MKTNTTIEINGKRYDAVSGLPVGGANQSRSIDGVVRSAHTATPKPHPNPAQAVTIPAAHTKTRAAASHGKTHAPSPSHTLMRQAVKKPAKSQLAKLKVQPRTDVLVNQPSLLVEPKLSVASPDPKRIARANHVARSKLITKFGKGSAPESIISSSVLDVLPASTAAAPSLSVPAAPPSQQHSMDIFERALKHANSHEQPRQAAKRTHKKQTSKAGRITSVSSAALAVLLIGGFLAYQNVSNVTVRLASSKAGFAASLPGYKPSGFSVGKFAYSAGNVTINFHSNSDDRRFALIEQRSDWDSDTLLNEFVATRSNDYQTMQTAGRTVYIYGNNNATWVNGGVWYQVNTQGNLSQSQLLNLASSM